MWPSAETRSQESHSPLKLPRAPLLSASPSPPAPPLSSCDLFSLPIALPFLECHRNGIIQKLAFRVWFFNLAECWLNECLTLTYVSAKMDLFLVTAEWCIVSCMSQRLFIHQLKDIFVTFDIWLPGEISITSDMQMTPPLWQKVKNWRASRWKWKRRVKKLA